MNDDLEPRLRECLRQRAEGADEFAISGYTVRQRAERRRRRIVRAALAPAAAAFAVGVIVAGVALASPSRPSSVPATAPTASVSNDVNSSPVPDPSVLPRCDAQPKVPAPVCLLVYPPGATPDVTSSDVPVCATSGKPVRVCRLDITP